MFNAQGDVVALVDGAGKVVVEYSYDAWGQPLTITGSMMDTLGKANPLRYRCYVYDEETGMYYLGSRYYNPVMGRFINADNVIPGIGGDLRGYSAFAYCFNNPINMCDLSGHWPKWIEDVNNWFIDNVVKPTKQFVKDIKKDVKNFDINNKSERKVLESYGGVLSRNHSQSSIENGFAYLKGSQITGPLIWTLGDY